MNEYVLFIEYIREDGTRVRQWWDRASRFWIVNGVNRDVPATNAKGYSTAAAAQAQITRLTKAGTNPPFTKIGFTRRTA